MVDPRSAAEMRADEEAWIKSRPMKVGCALCAWTAQGTAGEVLEAQKEHRIEHGYVKRRRRRSPPALNRFRRPDLSEDELDEIERARRQRALVTGVDLED